MANFIAVYSSVAWSSALSKQNSRHILLAAIWCNCIYSLLNRVYICIFDSILKVAVWIYSNEGVFYVQQMLQWNVLSFLDWTAFDYFSSFSIIMNSVYFKFHQDDNVHMNFERNVGNFATWPINDITSYYHTSDEYRIKKKKIKGKKTVRCFTQTVWTLAARTETGLSNA